MRELQCACLFSAKAHCILVVRVRQNDKWYLAGGKIELGETPEEALCRELREELTVHLQPHDLRYRSTVTGPAYGRAGSVSLVCFEATSEIKPQPAAEVTEAAWLGADDFEAFAPAVQILYKAWREGSF